MDMEIYSKWRIQCEVVIRGVNEKKLLRNDSVRRRYKFMEINLGVIISVKMEVFNLENIS